MIMYIQNHELKLMGGVGDVCCQCGVLVRTSTLVHMLSWPLHMKFLCTKDQRYAITVQLTFLAHSVLMRPNFQGLPWFKCNGIVEDELLIRFLLN